MVKRILKAAVLIGLAGWGFPARCQSGAPPTIVRFDATPANAQPGQSVVLTWVVQNATAISISGIGIPPTTLPGSGSVTVNPVETSTYTLTASNAFGSASAATTVTVLAASLPQIIQFVASPSTMVAGQQSKLTWQVANATTVTITDIGLVVAAGSVAVTPVVTTKYVLRASNAGGSVTADATVQVTAAVFVDRTTVDLERGSDRKKGGAAGEPDCHSGRGRR